MRLNKKELLSQLESLQSPKGDCESKHIDADNLLLQYIDDAEIALQFQKIPKWYA